MCLFYNYARAAFDICFAAHMHGSMCGSDQKPITVGSRMCGVSCRGSLTYIYQVFSLNPSPPCHYCGWCIVIAMDPGHWHIYYKTNSLYTPLQFHWYGEPEVGLIDSQFMFDTVYTCDVIQDYHMGKDVLMGFCDTPQIYLLVSGTKTILYIMQC